MTNEIFESLLFEEEGTTIDFKKEQYRFVNASEDDKSELVKDTCGPTTRTTTVSSLNMS